MFSNFLVSILLIVRIISYVCQPSPHPTPLCSSRYLPISVKFLLILSLIHRLQPFHKLLLSLGNTTILISFEQFEIKSLTYPLIQVLSHLFMHSYYAQEKCINVISNAEVVLLCVRYLQIIVHGNYSALNTKDPESITPSFGIWGLVHCVFHDTRTIPAT